MGVAPEVLSLLVVGKAGAGFAYAGVLAVTKAWHLPFWSRIFAGCLA